MSSVFVKVSVKDMLPKHEGYYHTDYGIAYFSYYDKKFYQGVKRYGVGTVDIVIDPEYFLEEVELPNEKDLPINVALYNNTMYHDMNLQEAWNKGVVACAEYILNKLKGETK